MKLYRIGFVGLSDSPSEQEKQDFAKEIELMKRIGFAKHSHVVGLFGVVTVPEPICILLEYLEYGDLLSYLQDIREEVRKNYIATAYTTPCML